MIPTTQECAIEIHNDVTGEVFSIVSPQSRGELIENLLHLDQVKAREDEDYAEPPPLVCCCWHVFKGGPIVLRYFTERDPEEARAEMRRLIESGAVAGTDDIGYPVHVWDDTTGARRVCRVPLPREVIIESLRDAEARDDSGIEPSPAEVVGHVRPDSIVLRFWSPLPAAEAREAVAAAIADWEEAVS